ncbi:Transferring glycosyl group transferase [Quillaja saponaria]|nr:Transferring glycosyl group transferase [Quillaja saponaria]
MRIGLFVCLIASISLAIYSAFSKPTGWFPYPYRSVRKISDVDSRPTNISHILFGLAGSLNTWRDRSRYSQLWWDENTTRGFVWLDGKPDVDTLRPEVSTPYRISEDWTRFKYSSSQSAVRIARIIYDNFKLGLPNVRWFVMGDDDTVFFTENLVSALAKYDHNKMYYIGGNSESVEQDVMHAYDMAFGGGGFAVSYPLAELLIKILDGCLFRYYYFYGSDQRIWACVSELGVPLTRESGFHQFDIRGSPYGLLAAHPVAPLVSLHHLDYLDSMFPNKTQIESLKSLMDAYRVDPARLLQQSFCYDRSRRWSISISWGFTIQIYTSIQMAKDLQVPLQTFRTWRSWSNGPFTFNTRPVTSNPCEAPVTYFLDHVEEVGKSGSFTSYKKFVAEDANKCKTTVGIDNIVVSAMKMDPQFFSEAPRRQCCEIMDRGKLKNGSLRIRIRKCRVRETITM